MAQVETIEEVWRRGRAALDAARIKLAALAGPDADLADILDAMTRGALSEALAKLAERAEAGQVDAEMAAAVAARDHVIEAAQRAYGPGFRRMAQRFRGSADPDDDVDRAWERIVRNIYAWQQTGEFHAWLGAVFRSALLDGVRRSERRADKHRRFAGELALQGPATDGGKGTTAFGNELALQGFKDSLEPDKRGLWDDWARLGTDGMRPEEIYAALAEMHGKSAVAIKGAVLRLLAEFKAVAGANAAGVIDASETVALWVGSQRDGERTTILATGIDADDRVRLLAMRQVRHVQSHAFTQMFSTLRRRGLPQQRRMLLIADNSHGLRQAIHETFAERAVVQPCQRALVQRVCASLPSALRAQFVRKAERAYQSRPIAQAQQQLRVILAELRTIDPGAAERLAEELEASLTVKRLGLPAALEEQLSQVKFLGEPVASPNSWLGGVFAGLRERRSVDRRREGLKLLLAKLAV